jgi:hypothetical protein
VEDHTFDALTRSVVARAGTRRALLRLVTGSVIAGVAGRLTWSGAAGAKSQRREPNDQDQASSRRGCGHSAHRPSKGVQSEGKGKGKGKGQGKGKGHQKPPKDPRPPCGKGMVQCPEKTCVRADACCNGDKQCTDGSCVSVFACCPGQSMCADGSCVGAAECCEGERQCYGDTVCVATEACCPSEKRCDDGSCVPGDTCCPGQKRCGNACIPQNQCCAEDPDPLCNACEALACVDGEKTCVDIVQGSVVCSGVPYTYWPSLKRYLPKGCCAPDHYVSSTPVGPICAEPLSGGTGWRCD